MLGITKKIASSKWAAWLAVLAVAFWVLDETVFTNGTVRYKMTVRIDTPEGIKEGSAVREVYMSQGIKIFPESGPIVRVKGEAVVVDLGQRGQVFALLKGYLVGAERIMFYAFPEHGGTTREGIRFYRSMKEGKAVLSPKFYPYLIRFKDIDDPQSIEAIIDVDRDDDEINEDHFEEMFGKGVKLKDITIEVTDDSVSHDMSKWPEWFKVPNGKMLGSSVFGKYKYNSVNSFSKDEFLKGF